jgi:hypothetical protein
MDNAKLAKFRSTIRWITLDTPQRIPWITLPPNNTFSSSPSLNSQTPPARQAQNGARFSSQEPFDDQGFSTSNGFANGGGDISGRNLARVLKTEKMVSHLSATANRPVTVEAATNLATADVVLVVAFDS